MYAIIKSGGKQYRVTEGQTLRVEKLSAQTGEEVTFSEVLLFANDDTFKLGAPCLTGVTVTGTVVEQGRGKKINIIKFRRRKHHLKRMGHRQNFTAVQINTIAQN